MTRSVQGITWRLGFGIQDPTQPEGLSQSFLLIYSNAALTRTRCRMARPPRRREPSSHRRHVSSPLASHRALIHRTPLQCEQSDSNLEASSENSLLSTMLHKGVLGRSVPFKGASGYRFTRTRNFRVNHRTQICHASRTWMTMDVAHGDGFSSLSRYTRVLVFMKSDLKLQEGPIRQGR